MLSCVRIFILRNLRNLKLK